VFGIDDHGPLPRSAVTLAMVSGVKHAFRIVAQMMAFGAEPSASFETIRTVAAARTASDLPIQAHELLTVPKNPELASRAALGKPDDGPRVDIDAAHKRRKSSPAASSPITPARLTSAPRAATWRATLAAPPRRCSVSRTALPVRALGRDSLYGPMTYSSSIRSPTTQTCIS